MHERINSLGRKPSPPDERDFKLKYFLDGNDLDAALAVLLSKKGPAPAVKVWATFITNYLKNLQPSPPNPPAPTPQGDVVWANPRGVLDQGDTSHCVGFAWAQWGNNDTTNDDYLNPDGNKIYYECKVIDKEPNQEDGSTIRSGAKAMKNRSRLSAYAFASTLDEVKQYVRTQGPLVVGTDWYDDMFYPDSDGLISISGSLAGGHAYLLVGDLASQDCALFLNSWGDWANNGYFKMKWEDFDKLLQDNGEACASVELPL